MLATMAMSASSATAQISSTRAIARGSLLSIDRLRGAELAAQLGAQFLGDAHCVDAVADDLRPDEDDQFGALRRLGVAADQLAEIAELIHQRNAGAVAAGVLADQAGEQHGLPAGDTDRAFHFSLRHG